jgi:hypothetical protein
VRKIDFLDKHYQMARRADRLAQNLLDTLLALSKACGVELLEPAKDLLTEIVNRGSPSLLAASPQGQKPPAPVPSERPSERRVVSKSRCKGPRRLVPRPEVFSRPKEYVTESEDRSKKRLKSAPPRGGIYAALDAIRALGAADPIMAAGSARWRSAAWHVSDHSIECAIWAAYRDGLLDRSTEAVLRQRRPRQHEERYFYRTTEKGDAWLDQHAGRMERYFARKRSASAVG